MIGTANKLCRFFCVGIIAKKYKNIMILRLQNKIFIDLKAEM